MIIGDPISSRGNLSGPDFDSGSFNPHLVTKSWVLTLQMWSWEIGPGNEPQHGFNAMGETEDIICLWFSFVYTAFYLFNLMVFFFGPILVCGKITFNKWIGWVLFFSTGGPVTYFWYFPDPKNAKLLSSQYLASASDDNNNNSYYIIKCQF